MTIWQTMTGSDLTREWTALEDRAAALPPGHRAAWKQVKARLLPCAGFTGRSLTPALANALELLEETAADGQDIRDVLGDDIQGFAAALAGGEGTRGYRDRWRRQLNGNVARKLGRPGG